MIKWVVVVVVDVERAEFGQDSTRQGVRGKMGLDDRSELRRAFRTARTTFELAGAGPELD